MKEQQNFNLAIENNDYKEVKVLLENPSVDPSDKDNWAICIASEYGYSEVVKLLLSHPSVDPTDNDNSAIRWASNNEYSEVVKLLWKNKKVKLTLKNYDLGLYNKLTKLDLQEKIKAF